MKPPIGGNTLAQKKKSTQVHYNEMKTDVSRSNRSAADKSTGHIRAKSVDKTKSFKEKSKPSFVSILSQFRVQLSFLILIFFIRIKEQQHQKLSEEVDSSTLN